jgi:hypothetical protein
MNTTGRDPLAMPPAAMVPGHRVVYRSFDPNGEWQWPSPSWSAQFPVKPK